MRRLFTLLGVLTLVSTFLYGCGAEEVFKDEPDLTSISGILEAQSSDDEYLGTHLLVDDDGEVTALRSLSINLSNKQYLNNKIKAMGFMNTDDNVFEVNGVSVLEVLADSEDVSELIDYKNTDFGIQLKYYSDWEIVENGDLIVFFAPPVSEEDSGNVDSVELQQIPFTYSPTVSEDTGEEDTPLDAYASKNLAGMDYEVSQIGVDSLNALKVSGDLENVDYYLYRNGLIYKISFITSENYIASNKKVFNEMISEFKFTGFTVEDSGAEALDEENVDEDDLSGDVLADSTSDSVDVTPLPTLDISFNSFESLPYYFTAKYPSSWYYAGQRSSEDGVLHHYGFSDESITDTNELISLDILSGSAPSGKNLNLDGKHVTFVESGNVYAFYVESGNYTYRISGDKDYEGIMLVMADSVVPVEREE